MEGSRSLSDLKPLFQSLEARDKTITTRDKQIGKLQKQVQKEHQSTIDNVDLKVDALHRMLQDLLLKTDAEAAQKEARLKDLGANLLAATDRLDGYKRLERELELLDQENHAKQEQIEELLEKNAALEGEIHKLKAINEGIEISCKFYRDGIAEAALNAVRKEVRINKLTEEAEKNRKELSVLDTRLSGIAVENDSRHYRIKQLLKEKAELETLSGEQSEEIKALKHTVGELQTLGDDWEKYMLNAEAEANTSTPQEHRITTLQEFMPLRVARTRMAALLKEFPNSPMACFLQKKKDQLYPELKDKLALIKSEGMQFIMQGLETLDKTLDSEASCQKRVSK